jgi:hypothetical protein
MANNLPLTGKSMALQLPTGAAGADADADAADARRLFARAAAEVEGWRRKRTVDAGQDRATASRQGQSGGQHGSVEYPHSQAFPRREL